MSIVKIKGIPVELGGQTYVVPPIALGALEQLQSRITNFSGDVSDMAQVSTVIDAAFSALRRNYPDLKRDEVADLIDVANMAIVFEAVMDISGLKRRSTEEADKLGEIQPGV
ncbi:hypothetical protein [Uliginosibacterium gangwonense]|uniref:hypothetical protein n=1 Tax=Uliginosibacterium gangwonense TaxID=392736 RepID=UPI000366EC93|nr:hypothetical protein [Uliginosibacterium gangwonense]